MRNVLICSIYLVACIVFSQQRFFFSPLLLWCLLTILLSAISLSSYARFQWERTEWVLQVQMSSGFSVEGKGIIIEWGCHRPSGKKLQELKNCSISEKESKYFWTAVGIKSTGFVWEAKRSWKWHPGCELVGHKVVELLIEMGKERENRERLGRNVISALQHPVLGLVANIQKEILNCECEQKGWEICDSSAQRW